MAEVVEMYGVDALAAGAIGPPGERVFLIEAVKGDRRVSVAVEKEQVALLAREATQFLDKLAVDHPEDREVLEYGGAALRDPSEPLFRARLIGIGFDPADQMVLVELRERADAQGDDEVADPAEEEGRVVRFYATRAQVRAMVASGVDAVHAGRARWN